MVSIFLKTLDGIQRWIHTTVLAQATFAAYSSDRSQWEECVGRGQSLKSRFWVSWTVFSNCDASVGWILLSSAAYWVECGWSFCEHRLTGIPLPECCSRKNTSAVLEGRLPSEGLLCFHQRRHQQSNWLHLRAFHLWLWPHSRAWSLIKYALLLC